MSSGTFFGHGLAEWKLVKIKIAHKFITTLVCIKTRVDPGEIFSFTHFSLEFFNFSDNAFTAF